MDKVYFIIILGVSLCLKPFSYSEDLKPNLLILHSYHHGLEWTDSVSDGIYSALSDIKDDYNIYIDYLDTKRNTSPEYFNTLVELYAKKSKLIEYDLVIISDNNAFSFFTQNRELFPNNPPAVFCGINNYDPSMHEGITNITGVRETTDFEGNIKLIMKLHPQAKRIVIVNEHTNTGKAIRSQLEKIVPQFSDQADFLFADDISIENIKDDVQFLRPDDVIYLLTFNKDSDGNFVSYKYGCMLLREVTDVPIYGSWQFYLGKGIVGGNILSGFDQGFEAGAMAKKILNGKKAEDIPVNWKPKSSYQFDYTELIRFGIDLDKLPKKSVIINKPSIYTKKNIWIFGSIVGLLTLAIIILIIRIAYHRFQKKHLQIKNEELDKLVSIRTQLLEKEIEERKEIEEQLRESNNTKDKFFSIIGHDLKNPFWGIMELTQLLASQSLNLSDKELKSIYLEINKQCKYTYNLLQNLLTWANIKQNKITPKSQLIRLNEIVAENLSLYRTNILSKAIAIKFDPLNVVTITSDQFILSTIVNNILGNAIKFTPQAGEIEITVTDDEHKSAIVIKDSGIGMDNIMLEEIFQSTYSSRKGTSDEKGTGLGLEICNDFSQLLNCKIVAHSDGENKGSVFEIIIPRD